MINPDIKRPEYLYEFFVKLHEKYGKFIVLRGYHYLPYAYSNDIDVYIEPSDIKRFFGCVQNLDGLNTSLEIITSRLGLIKCILFLNGIRIPFDILYGFYYFGLEYQSPFTLLNNSIPHESNLFYTPCLHDEIRISLLKELLHNKKIRIDKSEYLKKMLFQCEEKISVYYFNLKDVNYTIQTIERGKLTVPVFALQLRLKIIIYNIYYSPLKTFRNIFLFLYIKYISKNNFHYNLINS